MAKISYCVVTFLFFSLLHIASSSKCTKKDPCSCTIDEYSFVSLSQLKPPKHAFFQDGKDDISYFFSGCTDQLLKPEEYKLINNNQSLKASLIKCTLIYIPDPTTTVKPKPDNSTTPSPPPHNRINHSCEILGNANDINFAIVPDTTDEYQIVYEVKNKSLPSIRLICDTFNRTELKILSPDTDELALYSPLVCVQHKEHHDLSGGSIFCIIFFVAAFTYFIGGSLIMYFARGARGIEVIPNFDFWMSLPGLVKDGLVYVLSGCRPFSVSTAETYDRI